MAFLDPNKEQIREKINALSPISDLAWSDLSLLFETQEFKPNEKLLSAGEMAKYVYFIHSGLIRSYVLTDNGEEFSKSITNSKNFYAPISSLVTKSPSAFYVESLTKTIISKAPFSELEKLHKKHPDLEHFYRKQMEWLYIQYERSEIELATQDAKQRYLNLQKRINDIDNLIPQYKIASFLGITNVQLSRIRRNLK